MATTITMPQLGETVTEGTVAQWLKKPGDSIEKYEAFVEVSTDKVNAEVPSPVSGTLREIICKEGETVATGAPIAIIDEIGAAAAPQPASGDPLAATALSANGSTPHGNGVAHAAPAGNGSTKLDATALRGFSPAVRRLAREHQVDLARVRGTGTNGRVTARDVIAAASHEGPASAMAATITHAPIASVASTTAFASAAPVAPPPSAPTPAAAPRTATSVPSQGVDTASLMRSTYTNPSRGTLVPLSPARKLIARRMTEALATAPHAWTMVEVDVTNVWTWRSRAKERFQADRGYALTLLPFFMHAVARALEGHLLLNARYTDDGIVVAREMNIGIAIGLDSNLMVPVIKDADTLSIGGLAVAAGRLIERARSGTLTADDLSGGTFTVNNTGANGSVLSKPIINGGQAGIITMEAIVKRPVVINDAIAIRSMMNVCLSLDHRVIDGSIANSFLADVKRRLEAMGPTGDL